MTNRIKETVNLSWMSFLKYDHSCSFPLFLLCLISMYKPVAHLCRCRVSRIWIWATLGLVWNVCETLLKEAAWWWLAPRLLFGGCPCVIFNSFTLADYRHSSLSYFYNFSMPAALYCACCIHGWREKHAAGGACLHGTPGQFKQIS